MGALHLRFWGTRGLIPSPRKTTAVFGGNTTCMQVIDNKHLILVDSGYGIALFGEDLMRRFMIDKQEMELHIFYTHFHWDHILGLPFFHPIYIPSTRLHIYAPSSKEEIWKNLDILFDGSFSPFAGINSMPSQIMFHELSGPTTIGDVKITYIQVSHQIHGHGAKDSLAYAYRFNRGKESIVIACDHEAKPSKVNDNFIAFAKGASILVHDAQYTDQEDSQGLGHSTMTQALENARQIKAGRTLLTHHDPKRNDDELLALEASLKHSSLYHDLEFEFAREGVDYGPHK